MFIRQTRVFIWIILWLVIGTGLPVVRAEAVVPPIKPLIIGGSNDYTPYSFIDAQGRPNGFATDLSKEIMKETNTPLSFQLSPWPEALHNLNNGTVDIVQDMVYSEEREILYDFSIPYFEAPYTIFIRKGDPHILASELKNHSIIIVESDIGNDYLRKQGVTAPPILTPSYAEALQRLSDGDADCVLMEKIPGLYWINQLNISNLQAEDEILFEVAYCYAVKEGNDAALAKINAGLTIAREDGSYDRIYNTWFGLIAPSSDPYYQQILEYLALGILGLIIIILLMTLWSRSLKRQVAARTLILNQQNEELLASEKQILENKKELRLLNEELEKRVEGRTLELRQLNEELKSFSYSISHDLRGPLRAIDGFSRILLEDYTDKLDSEGKRYLIAISKNAVKMGQLISDLLTFTEMSRLAVEKEHIDMTRVARSAFNEAIISEADRDIDFLLEEMPPCMGNEAMIKQLLLNLISNALKFTRKQPKAVVTVGSITDEQGQVVYFVRDNGDGFDMKYVSKLFMVFNRLHHFEEYEGTGVGLAIAHRVVERHGGTIWAQAALNAGAAFYFTLNGNHGTAEAS